MYFNRIGIGNKIRKPRHKLKSKARAMLCEALPAPCLLLDSLISCDDYVEGFRQMNTDS